MRALITGANGFVGGHLCEHLLDGSGWQLVAIGREARSRYPELQERISFRSVDLLDAAAVSAQVAETAPDVVFHLAAQAHPPTSFRDPAGTLTSNMLMQLNLFEGIRAARLDPVVLVVSTGEVYGAVRAEDLPIDEDTPLRPVSPYAVSKITQDMLAFQYWAAHGLRTIRMRPFNHTGPRQDDGYAPTAFARQIARIEAGLQTPVVRVGNLTARRDYTDVRDVVRAYGLVVQCGEAGQVYNLGSGRAVSIQDILDGLLRLSRVEIAVESDPDRMRPADTPEIVCDASRLRRRTGWQPAIPLEQTLSDLLGDWRERVALRREN